MNHLFTFPFPSYACASDFAEEEFLGQWQKDRCIGFLWMSESNHNMLLCVCVCDIEISLLLSRVLVCKTGQGYHPLPLYCDVDSSSYPLLLCFFLGWITSQPQSGHYSSPFFYLHAQSRPCTLLFLLSLLLFTSLQSSKLSTIHTGVIYFVVLLSCTCKVSLDFGFTL